MKLSRLKDDPDFVNGDGVKWWRVGQVWMVELPSGERQYVAAHDGRVVYSSQQLEAVALWMELSEFTAAAR